MQAFPFMQNAQWIVILPFLAGTLIILLPFLFPKLSRDTKNWKLFSMTLSVGAVVWGFTHSLFIFNELAKKGSAYVVDVPWFVSSSFTLTTGLLIDNLTGVMLIVVTLVSLLVQIYTHSYMREDPGYSRFYAYLSLFTGSMLGLVVATNLFQMYLFWELVGVCSYFLIGFWFYKKSAADACMKAFLVNRIGDFGFLIGILMLLHVTWGFWAAHPGHGILTFADPNHVDITAAIKWAFESSNAPLTVGMLTIIAGLMFMGPMAKSAQVPLHVWLPDAMEGPTPISALIHAATMVAAGVYMVARAYPIWLNWSIPSNPVALGSGALAWVAWIGAFTAFMAATIALTQVDIKRGLAWSTVSQLGYMFAALGCGGFTGGIFHLFTHAFFKAMLFLCSGSVIHALHGEQDMRKMGGLARDLPYTHFAFLVGCIAISGIPPLAAFFSKDEILASCFAWKGVGGPAIFILLVFTAGLTAFYMFRMYYMTFVGKYRGEVHPHAETSITPLTAPLLALALPSIAAGWLGIAPKAWTNIGTRAESPFGNFVHFGHELPEPVSLIIAGGSFACAAVGILLAWQMYSTKSIRWNESIAKASPALYQFSFNRWYWDTLYLRGADLFLMVFRGVWTLVDKFIIDNIVNLTSAIVKSVGNTLRYSENGRGQYYAMVIFACVAGITFFVYLTR